MSLSLIHYALMAALRDRLLISLFVSLLVASSLAVFFGSAAAIEQDYFALVFTGSGLRFVSILGLVLFVVFFIRRSFDSKDMEFLLSRPVGRLQIIFSYAAAFSLIGTIMACSVGIALWAVAPHLFGQGHIIWIASVAIENIIMVNTALFFAMYISSAVTASMSVFGFYVLGRMMGQLLGIIDAHVVDSHGPVAMALQLVSIITPRLDLLGQSSWLIYGVEAIDILPFMVLQGAIFSVLVLLAASLDFVMRQF